MRARLLTVLPLAALLGGLAIPACGGDSAPPSDLTRIRTDRQPIDEVDPGRLRDLPYLRDAEGRYVILNGINVSGDTKVPFTPDPRGVGTEGWDEAWKASANCDPDNPSKPCISFIGRPFPLDDVADPARPGEYLQRGADYWFGKLRADGFNTIRLLTIWEAVEHEKHGKYDRDYLAYFEELVKRANDHGIHVLINFHENIYSRFLYTKYNENPDPALASNSILSILGSIFPDRETLGFTDWVGGDGAPRYAVEACLPEKEIDAPSWGMFRILGAFCDTDRFNLLLNAFTKLFPGGSGGGGGTDPLISYLGEMNLKLCSRYEPFDLRQTNDFMPWTFWGINVGLSLDSEKCYAAFYAGDKVFPNRRVVKVGVAGRPEEGYDLTVFDLVTQQAEMDAFLAAAQADPAKTVAVMNVKEVLQEGFFGAWLEVVKRVKKYPNVIGYDLLNEPPGLYIALTAASIYVMADLNPEAVRNLLINMLGEERGQPIYDVLFALGILPMVPDRGWFETEYLDGHAAAYAAFRTDNAGRRDAFIEASRDDYWSETAGMSEGSEAWDAFWDARFDEWLRERFLADNAAGIDAATAAFKADLKQEWGLADFDALASLGLNTGFERDYLMAVYKELGRRIAAEDPDAIIWLAEGGTPAALLGSVTGGAMSAYLYRPDEQEIPQVVYTPHWYPDIYPYLGFNMPPRWFVPEEWTERDFGPNIVAKNEHGRSTIGNVPIVFGEFGTYWNYSSSRDSSLADQRISAEILDNYYEAFEAAFQSRIVWCFSAWNDPLYGDLWNHEDFSLYGPDRQPRGALAWQRPFPLALSGRPKATHFYSDYHSFQPPKGGPIPWREYHLSFESRESPAPSAIYVPKLQYPDGFYAWLSDGWATYDDRSQTLYWYPSADEPGWTHELWLRPPQAGAERTGWNYLFRDGQTVAGTRVDNPERGTR